MTPEKRTITCQDPAQQTKDGCFLPTLCARRSHAQPSPAALTPGISKLAFAAQSSTENSDRDQMHLRRQARGPMKLQSMSEICQPEQRCYWLSWPWFGLWNAPRPARALLTLGDHKPGLKSDLNGALDLVLALLLGAISPSRGELIQTINLYFIIP